MPTNCQTEISDTVMRALFSRPSQGAKRNLRPIAFRKPEVMPQVGLRMSCQTKPMMTTESMVGMKIKVR